MPLFIFFVSSGPIMHRQNSATFVIVILYPQRGQCILIISTMQTDLIMPEANLVEVMSFPDVYMDGKLLRLHL